MEEIAENIIKGIWSVIHFILWLVLFQIIIFNIGRVSLLIITLGKYPRFSHIQKDTDKIIYFGLFLIVAAWATLVIYNNVNT